ncbi:MAG: phage tail tape measure protein [Prevotellaceae bacterium]|nr:phage tail tape measure protein [Candidatus Faecinaster equi]
MKNYQVVFSATIDAKQLQAEVDKIAGKTKMNFNAKGITDFGNAAKSSGGMLGEFTSQLTNLSSTIPKVAAFGVATAAIGAFTAAASDAVSQVFELDSAITEFRKVSELSGEGLEEYTDKLANLGSEVARTRSEMVQASTEFVKSGYSEEDSAILAQMAAMYQNIADEEISAGDSASFIIAQMKAFNIEAQDSVHIIDAVVLYWRHHKNIG